MTVEAAYPIRLRTPAEVVAWTDLLVKVQVPLGRNHFWSRRSSPIMDRMKRRLRIRLLIALLLVLGIATIIKIAWWHPENDRITEENYERLADGMTQAEVEAILGPPMAVESYRNEMLGRRIKRGVR